MKVKIIYASSPSSLESDVNNWLSYHRVASIKDIKFTSSEAMTLYRFCAMIIYEE